MSTTEQELKALRRELKAAQAERSALCRYVVQLEDERNALLDAKR